jgi:hypothetical protein
MEPAISIADLLRAFRAIKPSNNQERLAIAQLLGLDWRPPGMSVKAPLPKHEAPAPDPGKPPDPVRVPAAPAHYSAPVPPTTGKTAIFSISGPEKRGTDTPLWPTSSGPFEPPAPKAVPLEVAPLFVPRWTRGILSTALAVRGPVGAVDLREVVAEIARGRLLRKLPRLQAAAMALRVAVLVDVGDSMLPFAEDQRSMIKAVRTLAGFDNVSVLKFTGTPLRGAGTDEMEEWPEYSFPSSGTHVLLLSDLGIGRPPVTGTLAGVEEWRRFSWELRRRGVASTAFVPYPARHWPPALTRRFRFVRVGPRHYGGECEILPKA